MRKILVTLVFSMLILSSCTQSEDKPVLSYSISTSYNNLINSIQSPFNERKTATLTAVGDIMFHRYQLTRAYNYNTSEFDFFEAFQYIEPYISKSDFAVGNLETTLAGSGGSRMNSVFQGYNGYPCFNTPDKAAINIKETGFDLLTTANNHSLDSNTSGLKRTLNVLDDNGILHVGTYRTKEDAEEIQVVNVNGIDFAFLGYTYSANGFTLPKEEEYMLNSLDMYDEEKLEKMYKKVRQAHNMDVDMVVVMLHYGNEYVKYPDEYYQRPIVKKIFESGADIILGSHPHVLQPIEIHEIEREDGNIETGLVIYSLGNFLSSQQGNSSKDTDIGVIMDIDLEQIGNNTPRIKGISLVPTFTYWTNEVIGIVPVHEVINNEEKFNFINNRDINRIRYAYDSTIEHLMTYLDYEYEIIDNEYYIEFN